MAYKLEHFSLTSSAKGYIAGVTSVSKMGEMDAVERLLEAELGLLREKREAAKNG